MTPQYKTVVKDEETGKEFTFTGSRQEVSEKAVAKYDEIYGKGHAVETEIEAALAYNQVAKEFMGEYAVLNEVKNGI